MQSARGKSKTPAEEVENEPETEETNEVVERPKKRQKTAKSEFVPPTTIHQSYVMKLFDRSVDLAKFDERSTLYPICRR